MGGLRSSACAQASEFLTSHDADWQPWSHYVTARTKLFDSLEAHSWGNALYIFPCITDEMSCFGRPL